jgi:hypothetical protein
MSKLELGSEVVDKVTGWRGIAVAFSATLGSLPTWQVQKRELSTDGKTLEEWFTEHRLSVVGEGVSLDLPVKVRLPAGFAAREVSKS